VPHRLTPTVSIYLLEEARGAKYNHFSLPFSDRSEAINIEKTELIAAADAFDSLNLLTLIQCKFLYKPVHTVNNGAYFDC
jgi:hypothetical protein